MEANATDSAKVDVFVGSGASLAGGSGVISLFAASFSEPKSVTGGVAVGGFIKGNSTSHSTFDGPTRAHMDGAVTGGAVVTTSSPR